MKKRIIFLMFTCMLGASALTVNANTSEQADIDEYEAVNIVETSENFFTSLPDSFNFASGVGAWGTSLDLNDDGSFTGQFHDTNMGESGENYPNGTVYLCDFSGKFSQPERIDDYTYSMYLEYLETEHPAGEEFYENGMKHVYSDPYGFDNAEEFYIYLPGAPVSEIPYEFMTWSHLPLDTTNYLPDDFYGIYNVNEGLGFVGYIDVIDMNSVLYYLETEDARINDALMNAMTQTEINAYSDKLYTLWDDELNSMWKELKEKLDKQAMDQLTNEQLQWISDKENAAAREAAPYEGGSLYSAVYSDVVYRWTKERVYYLVEKFPYLNE